MYDSILNDYYKQQAEIEKRCEEIEEYLMENYDIISNKHEFVLLKNGKFRKECTSIEEAIEVACGEDNDDYWSLESEEEGEE